MKIKISWGTGIVLAFIGFISFILFFVIKMTVSSNANHDLVTPNYYQKELQFQENLDAQNHANAMGVPVEIISEKGGIRIKFPKDYPIKMDAKQWFGTIELSKPNNKNLDQVFPLSINNHSQLIPAKTLVSGRWNMVLVWQYKGVKYRIEKGINVLL